jgi:hypothetical protein
VGVAGLRGAAERYAQAKVYFHSAFCGTSTQRRDYIEARKNWQNEASVKL